jgi:hypothetical protein
MTALVALGGVALGWVLGFVTEVFRRRWTRADENRAWFRQELMTRSAEFLAAATRVDMAVKMFGALSIRSREGHASEWTAQQLSDKGMAILAQGQELTDKLAAFQLVAPESIHRVAAEAATLLMEGATRNGSLEEMNEFNSAVLVALDQIIDGIRKELSETN